MENQTLVNVGGAVKCLKMDGDKMHVGGYLVTFGSPEQTDLVGDFFTAKTYFGAHAGDGVDTLFHHGIPLPDKSENKAYAAQLAELADHIFTPVKAKVDTVGIWAETVLDMSDAYEAKVGELVNAGKLGYSSGALSHQVKREEVSLPNGQKAYEVKRWVVAEASLTPTPCEPRHHGGVMSLKAFLEADSPALPETPADAPAFKSEILGDYAESDMTMSAMRSGFDRLIYNCIYNCLEDSKMTMAEKTAKISAGFDELKTLSLAVMNAIMGGQSSQDMQKAVQYLDSIKAQNTKSQSDVTNESRLDARTFVEESESALGAVKGCVARAAEIKSQRAPKGKTIGRVGLAYLTEMAENVETLLADVKAVIAAPDADASTPSDSSVDPPVEPVPTFPALEMLRMQQLRAEILGVASIGAV